jgi:hypothetical protein
LGCAANYDDAGCLFASVRPGPGFAEAVAAPVRGASGKFGRESCIRKRKRLVQSDAPPRRRWSKTGKILTIVGAGLIGAGTAALIHGQNTQIACTSNGTVETCADIAWRATGAIWAGAGTALVIIGATRRTDD